MSTMRWLHWVDFDIFFYFSSVLLGHTHLSHIHTKPNSTETNQMNCSAPCTFANYSTNIGNCRFLAFTLFDEHSWIVCLLLFIGFFYLSFVVVFLIWLFAVAVVDVMLLLFFFSSFHHSILLSNLIIIFSLFIFADKLIWDQLYGRALVQSSIC